MHCKKLVASLESSQLCGAAFRCTQQTIYFPTPAANWSLYIIYLPAPSRDCIRALDFVLSSVISFYIMSSVGISQHHKSEATPNKISSPGVIDLVRRAATAELIEPIEMSLLLLQNNEYFNASWSKIFLPLKCFTSCREQCSSFCLLHVVAREQIDCATSVCKMCFISLRSIRAYGHYKLCITHIL